MKNLKNIIRFPFLVLIRLYQGLISPFTPSACRYSPSCSEYAVEALEKFGLLKGGFLALKRMLRCHPWGGSGHDPVPKVKNNKDF